MISEKKDREDGSSSCSKTKHQSVSGELFLETTPRPAEKDGQLRLAC